MKSGFTLLEVMVAFLLVSIGLIGLAGTLGPVTALATEGRLRERAALVLESRIDRWRADMLRFAPACTALPAGSLQHADGVLESWDTGVAGGTAELTVIASHGGKHPFADTVTTRMPCP